MTNEQERANRDLGVAKSANRDAHARWGPVRELADRLHALRESNHFSEMITRAFEGRRT